MYRKSNKFKILIIAISIAVALIGGYFFYLMSEGGETIEYNDIFKDETVNNEKGEKTEEKNKEEPKIVIHIAGYIANPGIIELKENSRISDAIEKAGGLKEEADISKINLAFLLEDGMKIYIPSHNEIEEEKNMEENINKTEEYITKGSDNSKSNNNGKNENIKIDINKATQNELQTLPGIGTATAQKIIEYRNENGKFKTIEDIKNVKGIGDSKFNNIKAYIFVK